MYSSTTNMIHIYTLKRSFFLLLGSIVFILLTPLYTAAQSEKDNYLNEQIKVRKSNRTQWKKLSEKMNYGSAKKGKQKFEYSDKDGKRVDQRYFREQEDRKEFRPFTMPTWITGAFKYFFIAFVVIILIIVLLQVLKHLSGDQGNQKVPEAIQVKISELNHEMPLSDLEKALQEAIDTKDFKKTIRIYYLIIIKELSEKKFIKWKKQKTNRDYINELYGKDGLEDFSHLTLLFEKVWYGQYIPTESSFQEAEEDFTTLMQKIKQQTAK